MSEWHHWYVLHPPSQLSVKGAYTVIPPPPWVSFSPFQLLAVNHSSETNDHAFDLLPVGA